MSSRPHVSMYCMPFCPDCARARVWLEHHDIPYTDIDISTNLGLREKVAAMNNGDIHTPTFEIDGAIIVDFEPGLLVKALGITD